MTFLTVGEVADRYRRTPRQVLAAVHRGTLPANRPPGSKDYRIAEADAERLFGVVQVHEAAKRPARESGTARAERQLAEAGIR